MLQNKSIKILLLFFISNIFAIICLITFKIYSFDEYFLLNTYIQTIFLYFSYSFFIYFLSLINTCGYKKLGIICTISTAILFGFLLNITKNNINLLLVGIFIVGTIFTYLNSIINITNHLNTPIYKIISTITSNAGLVVAIMYASTFYLYTNISYNNIFLNKFIDQAVEIAIKQSTQTNIQNNLPLNLEGIDLNNLNINELALSQNVNTNDMQYQMKTQIKQQLIKMLEENTQYIKVTITFLILGYLRLFYSLAALLLNIILLLITKSLIYFGFLKEVEYQTIAKKIEL